MLAVAARCGRRDGGCGSGVLFFYFFYFFLAMNIEEPYPLRWNGWYHCAAIIIWGLVAIVLLLFGITLYSFIRSKTHPDLRFKDVFDRVFR
jgi:hypothetical protein